MTTTYYGIETGEEYKPWLWKMPDTLGKKGMGRRDGFVKASGKATYSRDVNFAGMLYAKTLLSPYAHARITSMDTTTAQSLPGVRKILRYDDPEVENIYNFVFVGLRAGKPGGLLKLIDNRGLYFGHRMGAIVIADSELICDEACRLILKNTEWEQLPFILDPEEAQKPGAPLLYPDTNPDNNIDFELIDEFGDIEKGMQEADDILEVYMKIPPDAVAGVEGACSVAKYDKASNSIDFYIHQQLTYVSNLALSASLGINRPDVRYHGLWHGGSFGAGSMNEFTGIAISALASMAMDGKWVKYVYDSHFEYNGEHHGDYNIKIGYKNDGTVTVADLKTLQLGELFDQLNKINKCSKVKNLKVVKTYPFHHRGPTFCYKHGDNQCLIQNEVFARVADALKRDPIEIALINDGCYGEDMEWVNENIKKPEGRDYTRDSLKECVEIGKKAIDWDNKWHQPGERILPNGNYHGMGFMWTVAWHHRPDDSRERYWDDAEFQETGPLSLRVHEGGRVDVQGYFCDTGTNNETTYAAIVAGELGVPVENVIISTRSSPSMHYYFKQQGGSRGICTNGNHLVRLARKARKLIIEKALLYKSADGKLVFEGKSQNQLDIQNGEIFEIEKPSNKLPLSTLSVLGRNAVYPGNPNSAELHVTDMPPPLDVAGYSTARQCYFMEVEVVHDTGEIIVKDLVIVNDIGAMLDPDTVIGQQRGGSYMGWGRSRQEEVIYDPNTGVKLNNNLIGYPIALINDLGKDVIDPHQIETALGYGPYGAYGVGESAAANICSLARYAVHNAIGKWVDLKTTPAKILTALGKV